MDRTLAVVAAAAIPLLSVIFYFFTRLMPPLWGYGLGLCCYWMGLAGLLIGRFGIATLKGWLRPRWPGPLIGVLCILPILVIGTLAALALRETAVPGLLIIAIKCGSILNGTLEELFWRRALLPAPEWLAVIFAVALFTAWHLALLTANGVAITGGPLTMLGGAAGLGVIWMAARLRTGTVGLSAASHVLVNVFALSELAARNLA